MNSTVSLIQLWHLCAQSQAQSEGDDADGVLRWSTLRSALDGLPVPLRGSVDDILRRHFGFDQRGRDHVNFARYWRGMEAMLQACGAFHSGGLDALAQQKVASLRTFRDLLLDELPGTAFGYAAPDAHSVMDIRRLFDRLRTSAVRGGSAPVAAYWDCRLRQLPADDLTVTGDEVASALIRWLEELLGLGANGAHPPAAFLGEASASPSAASLLDEPEHERTPMGRMPGGAHREAAQARSGGATGRAEPSGPGRGVTRLPPPPRRLVGEERASPAGAGAGGELVARRPGPGAAEGGGGAATPHWLHPGAGGVQGPPEVRRFHEVLARSNPGTAQQLFRVVREAVDEAALCTPAGAERPGALVAGVRSLDGVVQRQLRGAFRELEAWAARARRGGRLGLPTGHGDIIAGLLCSQARAAEVMERRMQEVGPAWHIACTLSRTWRRTLCGVVDRWRTRVGGRAAVAAAAGRRPVEDGGRSQSGA